MLHELEVILHAIVNFTIIMLELMGVFIIGVSGIKGFYNYVRHRPEVKLSLAKGLDM